MTDRGTEGRPAPGAGSGVPTPIASVIICAYTERRWDQIVAALDSVRAQTRGATHCVLVVDHNDTLLERARQAFPDVQVVANEEDRGLSGGRNSGVRAATGDILVFLDDDAWAEPDWLERLLAPYEDPAVIGTGGAAVPDWPDDRPGWFPPEFDWVVGCSYTGLPEQPASVRNPIGANMSFRREAFPLAGGFDSSVGRLGTLPLGCEETVFSIRVRQRRPDATVIYVPDAVVHHTVTDDRTTVKYFLRRCVAEGLSKATVTSHVGGDQGLASERRYVTRVLPLGFLRGLLPGRHDETPVRSLMIAAGLSATTLGYLLGRLRWTGVAGRLLGQKTS